MRQAAPTVSETSTAAKPRTNLGASDGPKLAHVTEQPGLPIKFDSKRGCDQIRARLYHDHRLIGLELARRPGAVGVRNPGVVRGVSKTEANRTDGARDKGEGEQRPAATRNQGCVDDRPEPIALPVCVPGDVARSL